MSFATDDQRKAAFARQGKPAAPARQKVPLSAAKAGDVLHTTGPHSEHKVRLVEDERKAANRIYEVESSRGRVGILGSELDSLASWWEKERRRKGRSQPEGEEGAKAEAEVEARRQAAILKRIDPRGRLKSKLARDLACDEPLDLGGWLAPAEDFPSALNAVGTAMEGAWVAPKDARGLREALRNLMAWAKIRDTTTSPETRDRLVAAWTKRLQDNQAALDEAIGKAESHYRFITPSNSENVARKALALLDYQVEDLAIQRVRAYVEAHHMASFRERQEWDAIDRQRGAYP